MYACLLPVLQTFLHLLVKHAVTAAKKNSAKSLAKMQKNEFNKNAKMHSSKKNIQSPVVAGLRVCMFALLSVSKSSSTFSSLFCHYYQFHCYFH